MGLGQYSHHVMVLALFQGLCAGLEFGALCQVRTRLHPLIIFFAKQVINGLPLWASGLVEAHSGKRHQVNMSQQ